MRQVKLAMVAACLSGVIGTHANAALYSVTELPTQGTALNSFATDINDSAEISAVFTGVYNPPIDLELIDLDDDIFVDNLTDIDAARNGNFNAEDLTFVSAFVAGQAGNLRQRIANNQSYLINTGASNSDDIRFIAGFDEIDADLGVFSRSTSTQIRSLNNQGVVVGTSEDKFNKLLYTNEDADELTYVLQDFGLRAFVNINGVNYGIAPEDDTVSGVTEGYDVNDNLLVVGYETIEPTESRVTAVENCEDDETRGDAPVESCYQTLISNGVLTSFQIRGALWQLNEQGEVVSRETLGLLLTPEDDDDTLFISRAVAVNEAGIAVGDSSDYFQDDTDRVRTFAAVFANGEVTGITDHDEYFNSTATDINDSNIVVGQASLNVGGFTRTKFFYYDFDADTVTYPDDFFQGSSSVARGINNNNLIVGSGELDSTVNVERRTAAFLYDIEEDSFQDLNDLVACDTPYSLVRAEGINDNNQIVATAVVRRQTFDILGAPRLDDSGEPVLQDLVVSVLLDPIANGQIDDCDPPPSEVQERSGGSFGWSALGLLMFGLLRRRFNAK